MKPSLTFTSYKIAIYNLALTVGVVLTILTGSFVLASPGVHAAALPRANTCQVQNFFGLVPWYQYLKLNPPDDPSAPCEPQTNFGQPGVLLSGNSPVILILLAVVDDLLRVAGFVAVAFVIYGGIRYTTSQGNPEDTAKAQSTIIDALIGLVIALVAVAFVSFIGNKLGG